MKQRLRADIESADADAEVIPRHLKQSCRLVQHQTDKARRTCFETLKQKIRQRFLLDAPAVRVRKREPALSLRIRSNKEIVVSNTIDNDSTLIECHMLKADPRHNHAGKAEQKGS